MIALEIAIDAMLAVAVPAYLITIFFFLRRIKKDFPEVWESLGRPTFFLNNSWSNSTRVIVFIIKGRYVCLGSQKLKALGNLARLFGAAGLISTCASIVVAVVEATK